MKLTTRPLPILADGDAFVSRTR